MRLFVAFGFLLFAFILGCVQPSDAGESESGELGTVKNLALACTQLEARINSLVGEAGGCSADSDCGAVLLDSCEFGCYLAKNNTVNVAQIVELVKQFKKQQCSTCAVLCDTPPAGFACIEKKCVIIPRPGLE